MHIGYFKRWHWACIGLALGLIFSLWRGWVGPEGTLIGRSTIESSDFEQMLVKKSPSGKPLVKDVRYYGNEEGTDWVTAQQLVRKGFGKTVPEEYIPVKIAAQRPYVPTINPPTKADANFTVIDYLKSMRAKNPELGFSTRWWDREPMRSPIFALVGMALMAVACPALTNLLLGGTATGVAHSGVSGADEKKEPEYDLSRFGKGKSESSKPVQRGPTEADLARLRELETELERGLAAKARVGELPAAAAPGAVTSEQPIRKLDAGPLETPIDDKPKPQKRYGGDFYPTETHVKRDET